MFPDIWIGLHAYGEFWKTVPPPLLCSHLNCPSTLMADHKRRAEDWQEVAIKERGLGAWIKLCWLEGPMWTLASKQVAVAKEMANQAGTKLNGSNSTCQCSLTIRMILPFICLKAETVSFPPN